MPTSTIFNNNRSQAVRLPAEARFPDDVKRVEVRVLGTDRVITPAGRAWDSFFDATPLPTDDFLAQRGAQLQGDREPF
jgi:antitoxin VapB